MSQPVVAARKIDLIGYERLRIYFLSRRQMTIASRPFIPGTTYQDIIQLYEADAKIRDASFSAVGQFEILLRNAMAEQLSQAHGSHPYYQMSAYRDAKSKLDAIQTFCRVYAGSKDQRAKHYQETYSEPMLPAIWTLKEFLTFGAAARLYGNLAHPLRAAIAADFGVPQEQFGNWLLCLVDLRNICAHHDRLFNRKFQKQPSRYRRANLPTARINSLKAVLECLDYVLDHRGMPSGVTARVSTIIARNPVILPAEAGF